MSKRVGRNDPCPCGSGKKFKRCCLATAPDLRLATPQAGGSPGADSSVTILVDTARGVMARTVPDASPLRTDIRQGYAAEAATHDAAAVWGLPDFVFRSETQRVGPGTRELGDGILLVGEDGVVVQVKSREVPSGSRDKERAWLAKKCTKALSQGAGTVRRLHWAPVALTNRRGTTVDVEASRFRWLIVVVLDHPEAPDDFVQPLQDFLHPAVVLLRRDWEFLFDQLKSTRAVVDYHHRVAGEELALGREPIRYYDLAQADAAAPREAFPPELAGAGRVFASPMLPVAPAATDDRAAHQLVRALFEDIATARFTKADELNRLRILAELDRLPVGQRAQVGQFVLEAMQRVSEHRSGDAMWQLRSLRGDGGGVHLGFGACSRPYTEEILHTFALWAQLRHRDVVSVTRDVAGLTTVAVLVTPRTDGRRPWDTTVVAVSGDIQFAPQELATLRSAFPASEAA